MTVDIETVVVGGGVVGLSVARALASAGGDVVVLERNSRLGAEVSSRNSEVIHAGIYYPAGSLRARLCVAGRRQLYAFAEDNGVATKRSGKLIVATDAAEKATLERIAAGAAANGVDDLSLLSRADAMHLEPELDVSGALLSPSTGVIDSHGLLVALEGHVLALGGQIALNTTVASLKKTSTGFAVSHHPTPQTAGPHPPSSDTVTCRTLVNAAGLGAVALAHRLADIGRQHIPTQFYAKGHYYGLVGACPFERLVYPVPNGAWLGVHVTRDVGGRVRFGPDCDWVSDIDYTFEDHDGRRRDRFATSIQRFWPTLNAERLVPDTTGIRPKLYAANAQPQDFQISLPTAHGVDGYIGLYGIESPGLTASLAIGDHVASSIRARMPADL